MLQAEPFEKIILTSYDITYVAYLREPPIKSKYWPLAFIFIAFRVLLEDLFALGV